MVQQAAAVHRRALAFRGRTDLVDAAAALAAPLPADAPPTSPRIIFGASGSGKTFLVCKAATLMPPAALVVARLCGTSAGSSSGRALLRSICRQLALALGDAAALPDDLRGLSRRFGELLGRATPERPIAVFIDSLDQLTDEDFAARCHLRVAYSVLYTHSQYSSCHTFLGGRAAIGP